MRLVRMLVSGAERTAIESVLDGHNVDYVVTPAEDGDADVLVVEFPLPTQAVESILDEIRETRNGEDTYTVVTNAESVFSEHADEMESRFITGTEEDDSIATEEIRSTALDMTPSPVIYYSMTLLSAFVATAGLLLDSPAIVVGSMVIAPLVGSALTASVGTVLNEREMVVEGFKTQLFGLALAVAGATAFSFGLRSAAFLPPPLDVSTTQQIAQRISPGLLSVVVGVCAGAAGAFGLATGVSVTLVGVMIAAALIPAAAAVGVGLAWGIPAIALGAFLLLVLNAIAIHLSGATVLWYLGYRPDGWAASERRFGLSRRQVVSLVASVVVLGTVFVGSGAVVSSHIAFEQTVNQVSADVVTEDRYDELELASVRSEFGLPNVVWREQTQQVTVVVGRPVDRPYPGLSETMAERITDETGRDVVVVVEFVELQRAETTREARTDDAAAIRTRPSAISGPAS